MTIGWYGRLQLRGDQPMAPHRVIARAVLRCWRDAGLLAFRANGSWLRLLATGERRLVGERVRQTKIGLFRQASVRFHSPILEPVRDQWHLTNVFHLILRAGEVETDPFHDASNLPDLLGLRVLGFYTARNVRERLPRIKRGDLLRHLGVEDLSQDAFSVDHLVRATTAAAGLDHLEGRDRTSLWACTALVAVGGAELTSRQLARLTGRSPRTIRRLRVATPDPGLARAIRLQMGLRRQRLP